MQFKADIKLWKKLEIQSGTSLGKNQKQKQKKQTKGIQKGQKEEDDK